MDVDDLLLDEEEEAAAEEEEGGAKGWVAEVEEGYRIGSGLMDECLRGRPVVERRGSGLY